MTASFHVSVHDAAPRWANETGAILSALRPLVGRTFSAAVVPCWHGVELSSKDAAFARCVGEGADELLLHGWSHRRSRGGGVVALATGGADEFAGLPRDEAVALVGRGRDVVARALGRPVDGFLPPAWRAGPLDARALAAAGIAFRVGWSSAESGDGRRVRLATRSWDVSRLACLGWLGEAAGRAAGLRAGAVPTIAIHPLDVARGFLPRALDCIRERLAAGARPALVRDLLTAAGAAP